MMDKSGWGEGPWQDEPDRAEWRHAGLPCLAIRNRLGAWCGYAAVPRSHPYYGMHHEMTDLDAHGGLTYTGLCHGGICHVPAPGEPDDVWWFGFDCAHAFDFTPALNEIPEIVALRAQYHTPPEWEDVYRPLAYVQAETNKLAEQLAEKVWPPTTSTG